MKPMIRKVGISISLATIVYNIILYFTMLISGNCYLFDLNTIMSILIFGFGLTLGIYGISFFAKENDNVKTA